MSKKEEFAGFVARGHSPDEKKIDRMTKVWNELKLDARDLGSHAGIPENWSTGGDGGDVFDEDTVIARTSALKGN
jgi:hypothetical protein